MLESVPRDGRPISPNFLESVMSVSIDDKVYLFTVEDGTAAIEAWFKVMKMSPTHFDIEIKRKNAPRADERDYTRICLSRSGNGLVTADINSSVKRFREEYPQYGIEHFDHFIDGDEPFYVLGCVCSWDRDENGNGMDWLVENVWVPNDAAG